MRFVLGRCRGECRRVRDTVLDNDIALINDAEEQNVMLAAQVPCFGSVPATEREGA